MPIKLNTSSGGGVVLTGANTASDKTITVPAVDGTMIYADSSGNMQFNSGYGSVATAYGCRAWVNFNGTGTVAIRASGNVTSITDNGTGDYTVNFTNAMPDANYAMSGTCEQYTAGASSATNAVGSAYLVSRTTSSIRIYVRYTAVGSAAMNDVAFVELSFFR
jgi:hypothetical protein